MNVLEIKRFIPGIAWFFVVLVLLCLPGKDIPGTSWLDKIFFDKWVHAGIFGLLALLFMLSQIQLGSYNPRPPYRA